MTQPAAVLKATLTHTVPTGDDTVRNMDLVLLDAAGNELVRTNEFAQVSTLTWTGPGGQGVPAGSYTLRVENTVGVVPAYTLEAATHDILPVTTARQYEQWTLTCITAGRIAGQVGVSVERGQAVDVGDVCTAGLVADRKKPKATKPRR